MAGSKPVWGGTGDRTGTYIAKTDRNGLKVGEDVFDITPSIYSSKKDVIKRIFRNPDARDTYIGIGEWTDPVQGKNDIFISRIATSGLVSSTTGSDIIGVGNNQNDFVKYLG